MLLVFLLQQPSFILPPFYRLITDMPNTITAIASNTIIADDGNI